MCGKNEYITSLTVSYLGSCNFMWDGIRRKTTEDFWKLSHAHMIAKKWFLILICSKLFVVQHKLYFTFYHMIQLIIHWKIGKFLVFSVYTKRWLWDEIFRGSPISILGMRMRIFFYFRLNKKFLGSRIGYCRIGDPKKTGELGIFKIWRFLSPGIWTFTC